MSALPRGKINITEHMVVYPDGRFISLLPTTDTKSEEPVTMDLDITSMPVVSQDVGITENVNTLPAPAVEQTYSTNAPTTLNSASLAINKPLLLLTGESNMNPNGTALKTYSPKCKDAKLSVNTCKTYCNLRSSRARLSNKPIAVTTGSNTLLSNSSTSVIPAISPCSRPSYENSSQPAVITLKGNKVPLIIRKPHGPGVTSRSGDVLPLARISSKPPTLLTTTKTSIPSSVNATPKSLNFLSMEDSIGSTVHIQKKFESPTTAKNVKPLRSIIIKGSKGQVVKKLIGVEKLIKVQNVVFKKLFQERPNANSGSSVEIKSEQDTPIPSIDFNLPPLSHNSVLNLTSIVSAFESHIMTTHELSSTNTKIISDGETNILSTDVSEYVPIPITITHQKIVQSASQQYLLDTSDPDMPFSDTEPGGILFSSTQVSSPSSVSLPILDEDTTQQQTYSSSPISMPSLNEDCSMSEIRKINNDCNPSTKYAVQTMDTNFSTIFNSSNHTDFDHLSLAGAEPPSDMFESNMFDRYRMYSSVIELETNIVESSSVTSPDDTISMVNSHLVNINEDSRQIPAIPEIVTDMSFPYTTNSPFLTAYSSDQPMNFRKRYNEDESSDESPRKRHRYF